LTCYKAVPGQAQRDAASAGPGMPAGLNFCWSRRANAVTIYQ